MFNGNTPFSTHSHSDFSPSSEVVTTRQTDGAAHKLKPRSFHKSAHLWVHPADFHPGVNRAWHKAGFYAKVEKYEFHSELVEYLGYILSPSGLIMSDDKVKIIQDWPELKKVKDIQSFLGFTNFYY